MVRAQVLRSYLGKGPLENIIPEGTTPPGTWYNPAETGFYYLQSRYYDPEIVRFINADGAYDTNQSILEYGFLDFVWR